jgi:hypothetical protein
VFDSILKQMRERVRAREYVMTLHAEEEVNDEEWSVYDVESGILTGEITERQRDQATGEWKYLVSGKTLADDDIVVVGKLSVTGKLVIITVYQE